MTINRDLHVELEELSRRSTLDRGELSQKLRDFEALALERLTTINRLEAQVMPCPGDRPCPEQPSPWHSVRLWPTAESPSFLGSSGKGIGPGHEAGGK